MLGVILAIVLLIGILLFATQIKEIEVTGNQHYTEEQIMKVRSIDLLTYLQTYEPTELVHVRGNTYCTRDHDSLKISNGKWMWWSRGFGALQP